MLPFRHANKLRLEDFQVRQEDRPGWVSGINRLPQVGEDIYCAAGMGTVTALHGKTGNGSRLIQIALEASAKHPFYAAASNVLLPPVDAALPAISLTAHATATVPKPWLDGSGRGTHLS